MWHKLILTLQYFVTSPQLKITYECFFGLQLLSHVLARSNPFSQIVHTRKLCYLCHR
uniref:Uncharacterized protein n=1 Tax=Solanum lycopersicum TaxID=4081 RepID=A0A3Q7HK85_SOLLC